MSKNISIQEGGVSKQLTVDKLKTDLVGGGSCLWVPEDGTRLTTKYISENGTYKASDDGYYGYSEVTVSGVGSVVGRDSNGNEAIVTADPVTGDLVTTEIPSSILVVMPPTKTTYTDGETIDFTGLIVKAYTQDGEVWTDSLHPNGEIPVSELTLPVTVADYDSVVPEQYTDGNGLNAILVDCAVAAITRHYNPDRTDFIGYRSNTVLGKQEWWYSMYPCTMLKSSPGSTLLTRYNGKIYAANVDGDADLNLVIFGVDEERVKGDILRGSTDARAGDGVFELGVWKEYWTNVPESTIDPLNKPTTGMHGDGGGQTIPVQWSGRGDGQTLETNFSIQVSESGYGGATGGGGNTSGGGTGRDD